jgi:hypothetical protein
MSQREKEWRKGRFLARFGKGVDPGTGSTGNQTLGQLYSNRASTTTHSLPLVPPPHRPQPHAMLTVRSPLPRNASEIIHERPGRVLHGAAVTCASSRNLLLLPWPVSAGDPGVVQSVPSSSASMQCSPACRIAWRPRTRRKGADQESCSVSARPKGSVLSSHWLLFFVSVLVWELLAAHHYHGHAIALHQESAADLVCYQFECGTSVPSSMNSPLHI